MFFRKAKRIKELEKRVEELEAINRYNLSVPSTITRVKFETFCKEISFAQFVPPEVRENVVKKGLMSELCNIPYIKYKEEYDAFTDSFIGKASINIVTEER